MNTSEFSSELQAQLIEIFGANVAFIEELFGEYKQNPALIREDWQAFFDDLQAGRINARMLETSYWSHRNGDEGHERHEQNGQGAAAQNGAAQALKPQGLSYPSIEAMKLGDGEVAKLISGAPARIVDNMELSLSVPTATSFRTIPVKALEENRRIINQHLSNIGRGKIAFTHLIAWAIVKSLKKYPSLNCSFATVAGKPYRIEKKHINFGLAVDQTKKDGSRSLVVPNIKNAEAMNFDAFFEAYNALISKARKNALAPEDFIGTTASLTNPGTIGTIASVPRLVASQGLIVATGAIDYPAEYQAMSPEMLAQLGVSKVMTMTSTYDHRIIQGAESGELLANIHKLLVGEENFYDEIFADLAMPYHALKQTTDRNHFAFGGGNAEEAVRKQAKVMQLINSYRVRGHLIANINPLEYKPTYHPELDPEFYDLTIWDYDREFTTVSFGERSRMTLREIIETLRQAYCEKIGVEYMNIQSLEQKRWIQQHVENRAAQLQFDKATKVQILKDLIRAEGFERYLHTKFLGHKRFSIEGGETAIAIINYWVNEAPRHETKEIVIGMAHRGRLNVLTNVIGKPYEKLFAEFEGKKLPMEANMLTQGSGDVKYHLGATGKRTVHGKEIQVSVASNPSHLEAVNPVVEGIVRAKQERMNDKARRQAISLLVHGDAAFAGQGVVAETLNLSQLEGYTTGGSLHLIINNQIGFTTSPNDARSTLYASDVAKMVQAPILHVNGDDPEACLRAAKIALEYRMAFNSDVVIDMLCYRKHGHNEGDDPGYTQPVMYNKIRNHLSVRELYAAQLVREGVLTEQDVHELMDDFKRELDIAHEKAKSMTQHEVKIEREKKADRILAVDPNDLVSRYRGRSPVTKVSLEALQAVVKPMLQLPKGFRLNKKLEQQFAKRAQLLSATAIETPIDWAFAESLAFGTLLLEGISVRLSGQDSTRGTFSQRHLVFHDTETGAEYMPLRHIAPTQAQMAVYDSLLSEMAVMGFEFGYSVADPLTLVMWEAQFGDFSNGAQIIIDQFISSTESKWGQTSGLVLLLPHGYEGQGPEHSSARLERFLQLCAEVNIQVCNCTTPAQYFHLLRRQVLAGNIKPLVVMTPKSLLRLPAALSTPLELIEGKFHNVLDDVEKITNPKRVVLCSGKVYYDLLRERREKKKDDVVILRVEQFYPYPENRIEALLETYSSAKEIYWVQEEPKNMGAWSFMMPYLMEQLRDGQKLRYVGRPASASPATGFLKTHEEEQAAIAREAIA